MLTGLANCDATAVPFIADSAADPAMLMRQRTEAKVVCNAQAPDLNLISVGELLETSFLRRQEMLSTAELRALTSARGRA